MFVRKTKYDELKKSYDFMFTVWTKDRVKLVEIEEENNMLHQKLGDSYKNLACCLKANEEVPDILHPGEKVLKQESTRAILINDKTGTIEVGETRDAADKGKSYKLKQI